MRLPDELHQDLDRLAKRVQLEDLTADMRVQADQVEMRRRESLPDSLERYPLGQSETELGVDVARLHIGVCVGFDPRRDAKQYPLGAASRPHHLFQQRQFLEAVDHDEAHAPG